jgi:hypothetical protein
MSEEFSGILQFLSEKRIKEMIAIVIAILLNIFLANLGIDSIHSDALLYALLGTQLIGLIFTIFLIEIFINWWNRTRPGRVFKGQWGKYFKGPSSGNIPSEWSKPEVFEIRNGNQYIAYQEDHFHHRFDIINLKINKKRGT